jgi:cation diffusion facilitator CzcD-associated flavoprotein CzcO
MLLKSEGFATNIAHPKGEFTLAGFCMERGYPYQQYGLPIPRHVFAEYGLAFQKRFVPALETQQVVSVRSCERGFVVALESGERVISRRVVVATGIHDFRFIPPVLSVLGSSFVSHTGEHSEHGRFRGCDVCVVGSGASATDTAAALDEAGARVHLAARRKELLWVGRRTRPPRFDWWHLRDPLGAGRLGKVHLFSELPHLFRYLPERMRMRIAHGFLGPRGGWPIRERIERMPKSLGVEIARADIRKGRVLLRLEADDGKRAEIHADHVIAGTGYRIDLQRIPFLGAALRAQIRTMAGGPVLSGNFESSVPGLYFIGTTALYNFGPLLRFVAGTQFASSRVCRHVVQHLPRTKQTAFPGLPAQHAPHRQIARVGETTSSNRM